MQHTGKKGKTILLVEDDALVAVLQRRLLEKLGYVILSVSSGENAVSTVLKGDESIDLGPGIDGIVAAREVQKDSDS